VKVLFVSSGNAGPEGVQQISSFIYTQGESLRGHGIQIEYFKIRGKGIFSYIRHISRLRKYLQYRKFDLIHAHYGLCGWVVALARPKIPIVMSFMGDDLLGTVKKGQYTRLSKIAARINVLFAQYVYNSIIVKSEFMLSRLKCEEKVRVIPNGVNLNMFNLQDKKVAKSKLGLEQQKRYIIFVSNPNRDEKNILLAENSYRLLAEKNVELLKVYGIDHELLVNYYNAADCLILTSFHEGSPNVIKEAMACGCPIVATNVGDISWVIGNTAGCYLVTFNPEDVSQKLSMALSYAASMNRTNGRERIIEMGLSDKAIAKKMIEVYQNLILEVN